MESHPGVSSIMEMVDAVYHGRLRVPTFQRAFSWTPGQMLDLFESIERGLPIGSFVVWETDRRIDSTTEMGGQRIPEPEAADEGSYVVDGHQRLATLFGCLRRPTEGGRVEGA